MNTSEAKKAVREGYARIARDSGCCCGSGPAPRDVSKQIGYSEQELASAPEGANLGLGCGNPTALASLKPGEVVVDLGAGAGFDCFLAAERVGPSGRVIGVDMTPEMVEKARANIEKGNHRNVEFRLGEIEHLPVADSSADAVISNCVINLVPDKAQVFRDAFRVLKPGGRMMVSDIVLRRELLARVRKSVTAYVGCLSGAILKDDYLASIRAAGFRNVKVVTETELQVESISNDPTAQAAVKEIGLSRDAVADIVGAIASISVSAGKPSGKAG